MVAKPTDGSSEMSVRAFLVVLRKYSTRVVMRPSGNPRFKREIGLCGLLPFQIGIPQPHESGTPWHRRPDRVSAANRRYRAVEPGRERNPAYPSFRKRGTQDEVA